MDYRTLGDTVYFYFALNTTAGEGSDATGTPTYDVREGGASANAAPTLSGNADLLSHANFPAGCYEIAIAATGGNGFTANKQYGVFCTAAVSSVNPTGYLGSFILAAVRTDVAAAPSAATIAAAVWDYLLSAITTASTIGKLLKDNIDATISSRSSHSAADVWTSGNRTLTSFGTLVADVATAVWSAGTRTLTSFDSLVSDIITAYGVVYDSVLNAIGLAATSAASNASTAASNAASAASAASDAETAALAAQAAAEAIDVPTVDEIRLDLMDTDFIPAEEFFTNMPAASVELDPDDIQTIVDGVSEGVISDILAIPDFSVESVSPSDDEGNHEVRQGDAYLETNSRHLRVALTGSLPLLETACKFRVFFGGTVTEYNATVEVVDSTHYFLKCDLTGTQTAAMPVGTFQFEWEVTFFGTSNKWTPSSGEIVVKGQLA